MTSFQSASLVIGLLVVFGVPIIWWIFNSGSSPERNKAASERFRQRQCHPDFSAFQRHYGVEAPEALKSLFREPSLFTSGRDMFSVQISSDGSAEDRWFIAWIDPIDEEHLSKHAWPGTEGFYAFANDGSGDQYLIDPKDPDPEVLYFEHETGNRRRVEARLSQFVSAPRLYDEES